MARTASPEQPRRFRFEEVAASDLVSAFNQDGFVILENFLTVQNCAKLRQRASDLIRSANLEQAIAFSTLTASHAGERYFLESGDKIRVFLESETVRASDHLTCRPEHAVNKIGHALHDLDPVFGAVSRDRRLAQLATLCGVEQPLLLQSMYISKQAQIGGEVAWHQDATFLYTDPVSVLGFWFALDDADRENGAMEALAGGHRGPLRQRFIRRGETATFIDLPNQPQSQTGRPTLLEAKAGTLILLHGLLPHRSPANRSDRSRQAYTLHVVDGTAEYPKDNWLQRSPDMPLRGF